MLRCAGSVDQLGRPTPMTRFILFAALVLWTARCSFSQDIPVTEVMKGCSEKNPPPCVTSAPRATHVPKPKYSKEGRKQKIEGTVILSAVVGTDGRAHNFTVTRSLGYGLDEEAIKTVKKWKFKPGTNNGTPVATAISIEVAFRLWPGS
jgi:TonB family protein